MHVPVIPKKVVKIYPNNKPWVRKQLKDLLKKKKLAFRQNNLQELHSIQKEIKREIKRAKWDYKLKVEHKLSNNLLGSAWDSIKTMVGQNDKKINKKVSLEGFTSDISLAQELNLFYSRFDKHDFSNEIVGHKQSLLSHPQSTVCFSAQSVVNTFKYCKAKTSPGPDNIGSRVLSCCAEQLGPIFTYIFNQSMCQQKVPDLWKQSTIVPVAKNSHPKTLNDYRPIALTSLVMKSFEKLIKRELTSRTNCLLDPLQFAYRLNRGVQDATVTVLNLILNHLEGNRNHARLLFVDFSSAFNTIQPHLLVEKLVHQFKLEANLVGWILDFLTNRSQRVRVNGHLSDLTLTSTGSPQGCVLSPLFYILYTNDCRSGSENRHFVKFADDTVIVSLLNNEETSHGSVIDHFVTWCQDAFLELNAFKTKDMRIDFRRNVTNTDKTSINGQEIEVVTEYKYLGSIIDDKLCFESNTSLLCKKGQQRLYCLRKLAKFNVDKTLLTLFYRSFVESVVIFSLICWYGSITLKQKNSISRLIRVGSCITGSKQKSLGELYQKQMLRRVESILSDSSHPLQAEFQMLPSGSRYKLPKLRTNRYKHSFVPAAILLLNSKTKHR